MKEKEDAIAKVRVFLSVSIVGLEVPWTTVRNPMKIMNEPMLCLSR